jgi:hypothetical protein
MKALTVGIACCLLLPAWSFAQPGGFHGGGFGAGGFHTGGFRGGGFHGGFAGNPNMTGNFGDFGLPPIGPLPSLAPSPIVPAQRGFRGFRNGFGYGLPFLWADGEEYPEQGPPRLMWVVPQQAQPAPKPPEPPKLVVHDYTKEFGPETPGDTRTTFSIVGSDRTIRSAIAVWVQHDTLSYIAPDGGQGKLPMESVNREQTKQVNAEKGLTLWLPAPGQP